MDFSRIITWIKKYKWKFALIGVCLFLAPLLLVHLLYKWVTPYYILQSDWDSGDLITYIAGFEAFIGTLFLGTIAATQNEKNVDINDRLLKIEEASGKFLRYPNYKICKCLIEQTSISNIKDLETIIFHDKQIKREDICSPENLNKQFYRLSFSIENISVFNLTIALKKLILTALSDEIKKVEYNTIALTSFVEYFTLAAKQELQLSFMIYNADLKEYTNYLSEMDLLLKNNLGEEFILSLKFVISITEKSRIFKLVADKISQG